MVGEVLRRAGSVTALTISLTAFAIRVIQSGVERLDDGNGNSWPVWSNQSAAVVELAVAVAYHSTSDFVPRLPLCRRRFERFAKWLGCIDAELFAVEYYGQRPVVISGVLSAAERVHWSHNRVLADHGASAALAVTVGGAIAINEGGGGSVLVPMGDMGSQVLSDPRLFVFDQTTALAKRLAAQIPTPAVLSNLTTADAGQEWHPFVSLAGVRRQMNLAEQLAC